MLRADEYVTSTMTAEQEQQRSVLWSQHPELFSNKWTPERQQSAELFAAEFNQGHPHPSEEEVLDQFEAKFEQEFGTHPINTSPELIFFLKYGNWPERYYRLAPVDADYGKALIRTSQHTVKNSPEEFVQMVRLTSGAAEKIEQYKKTHGGNLPENIYPCTHEFTDEDASKVVKSVVVGKHLNTHSAANVTTRKVKWLWPCRVPLGKLSLFVGVPGSGKSLAAGDVAARLSTGKDWFDAQNLFQPSETLMLVGEDDLESTTVPRLQAAGADLTKIHFLKSVVTEEGNGKSAEERNFTFDKDLKQLEEFLISNPRVRLVVVDPISNYMGSAKMNAEQEVRDLVLIPLKNLAERFNVGVIGVMHLNKRAETDAINRVGGAMAFVGVARAAYLFQRSEPDDMTMAENTQSQHFMVLLKCNITKKVDGLIYEIQTRPVEIEGSPDEMPYIKFTSTTTRSADGILQPKSNTTGRPPAEMIKAKTWLRDFLKDGRQLASEVKSTGHHLENLTATTLDRAKSELGIVPEKIGTKWFWSLPVKQKEVSLDESAEAQL